MEPGALLRVADEEARRLLDEAEPRWSRPVPQCPEWDAAELVRHTGGVLAWIAAIVSSGDRVSRRDLPATPEGSEELPSWYRAALATALDVLGSADPDAETWTFSRTGDRRVRWWCRRLAVEVSIHRWDLDAAVREVGPESPEPIDGEVAGAGVEEFVTEFLPGMLAQESVHGIVGSLHLHATDGPTEWWIDLNDGGPAVAQHAKADTAVRGTRSDLLLWLNNRGPLESLEVFGVQGLLTSWRQLRM
jgi:uncharacterized protein (TIGR03083 family)